MSNLYNKYSFLFKPAFFIFCLLAGSWIVLRIEKLSPSDFGRYRSLFEREEKIIPREPGKTKLKKLVLDYKNGLIDSVMFETQMEEFFKYYSKSTRQENK